MEENNLTGGLGWSTFHFDKHLGQMSQMSSPLKKTLPWEKDKEYPARSVNNLTSAKLQDYPEQYVYPSHLPFLTVREAHCKYVLYFEMQLKKH